MLSQLDRIQIGVINVVSRTKYREIPSIPICRWQKVTWLARNSCVNWYSLVLESNSPHSTIEIIKFSSDTPRATRFILDPEWGLVFVIGTSAITPASGTASSDVSIIKISKKPFEQALSAHKLS